MRFGRLVPGAAQLFARPVDFFPQSRTHWLERFVHALIDLNGNGPLFLALLQARRSEARFLDPYRIGFLVAAQVLADHNRKVMIERGFENGCPLGRGFIVAGLVFQRLSQAELGQTTHRNVRQRMSDDIPIGVGRFLVLLRILAGELKAAVADASPRQRHQPLGEAIGRIEWKPDDGLEGIFCVDELLEWPIGRNTFLDRKSVV